MELITKSPSTKYCLTFLAFIVLILHVDPISATQYSSTNFIKKSCNTTTYPWLCIKTLSPYASSVGNNPLKLCNAALTVAIQATSNCSAAVTKLPKEKGTSPPEARAIKDCMDDMKDAVYELKQTVKAMGHLKDGDREFQWANAKTYASAAITDAETCIDGFLGRKVNPVVKKKISACVSRVEKLISNALSLINHLY